MDAFVEVIKADGTREKFPVEGAQVTLGKSGTAGISIPTATELELEHLLIAPRGKDGCWVSTAQGAFTPTLYKGKPFTSGMVPWGKELQIGKLRIVVSNRRGAARSKPEGGSNPVLIAVLLTVIALVSLQLFETDIEELPSAEGIEPTTVFAELRAECPTVAGVRRPAREVEYEAHSRGDGFRFRVHDGVQAVSLYAAAGVCYRSEGDAAKAEEMTRRSDSMRSLIDADYAARRLRLHHALETQDWEQAAVESRVISELIRDISPDDAYHSWLERTRRIVEARYEQQRKSRDQNGG